MRNDKAGAMNLRYVAECAEYGRGLGGVWVGIFISPFLTLYQIEACYFSLTNGWALTLITHRIWLEVEPITTHNQMTPVPTWRTIFVYTHF
jgi:hypothetical protein